MSAAIVRRGGTIDRLDGRAASDVNITAKDVEDPERLARLVQEQARRVSDIDGRWRPERVDHEDRAVVSGTPLRLEHGFGGRVRWWIVDWQPTTPGDAALFERASGTDTNTLVLNVGNSGTVSVRVERAG